MFIRRVFPAWLCQAFVLPSTTAGQAAQAAFTVTCDRSSGVYESGRTAVFTIARGKRAGANETATIKILRNNREVVLTETLSADEPTGTVRFTPKADGWYVCAVTRDGDQDPPAMIGVVFEPDAYRPGMSAPDDFDAFWAAQKARLAAAPAEPRLTPLTAEQRAFETQNPDHLKNILNWKKQGSRALNLEIACLDVKPVRGYYATPPKPAAGGHPAILYFRPAGVAGDWCRSSMVNAMSHANRHNALVIDLNAHGMLNGQPQSYYDDLERNELKGYPHQGKESRDTFYFLGMFLRLQRAIDFITAQPEWDGKHLVCIGISQGGAQVLAAAGFDSRVSAAVAIVPGMCDLTGHVADRPDGWPGLDGATDEASRQNCITTLRYFDVVNFCARSKADTLITVGLVDTRCPPTGVFTAYNTLATPKQIIPVPDRGHHALSSPSRDLQAAYNVFVLEHTRD
ncbi:MAG TPA: acetylxylan esterase [Rariglobus sp.]